MAKLFPKPKYGVTVTNWSPSLGQWTITSSGQTTFISHVAIEVVNIQHYALHLVPKVRFHWIAKNISFLWIQFLKHKSGQCMGKKFIHNVGLEFSSIFLILNCITWGLSRTLRLWTISSYTLRDLKEISHKVMFECFFYSYFTNFWPIPFTPSLDLLTWVAWCLDHLFSLWSVRNEAVIY